MTDVVQTVENVVSEAKTEAKSVVETAVANIIPPVDAAETAVQGKVVEVSKVVDAEVVSPVKTAAELAVDEINKAALVLYQAKQSALIIANGLKKDLQTKKDQVNSELAKLGLDIVQDAQIVEQTTKDVEQKVEALPVELENSIKEHSTVAVIISFIIGFVVGGLVVWFVK